ncbi:sensor histidine kinase [Limobrevibacterium gyesilva]|uniref:sensor histidine kinase n=1 Tax=Limobrevibacterium gyesilva TaxID=2991712 RepID=UPI002226552F
MLWALSLAALVAVGMLLVGLYRQSSSAQIDRATEAVAEACDQIVDRYAYYAAGWAGPAPAKGRADAAFRADLGAVLTLALAGRPGLAGGIWWQGEGMLAATVTPDDDVSRTIAALAADALADDRPASTRIVAGPSTVMLQACALPGPVQGLAGWVLAQVQDAPGQERLRLGLGVLFALALGMAGLLGWVVIAWTRRIGAIETALAQHEAGTLPRLAPTGERELDRIVAALNTAGERLDAARRRSDELAARVALSERLAALGRVAAGVAHEIRNPIAAMRLKAENALAGDEARRRGALEAILAQIARLDRLIAELLAMTQRRMPSPAPTDLRGLLDSVAADHQGGGVALRVDAEPATVAVDAGLLRRALDNLVENACQHTPPGGMVRLQGAVADGMLRISVADTGPGVSAELRASLFEPFVTGRADGTGLGLAIARELVEAHGGRIILADAGPGAVFTLEIPLDAPCR